MTHVFRALVERKDGKLRFRIDNEEAFRAHLSKLAGRRVELIVRKPRKDRSLQQNRYYWGVIVAMLSEEWGYEPEEVHEILLAEHSREVRGNPLAPPTIVRSSEMTTEQAEAYYERIRRWALLMFGLRIPLPNEVEL